MTEFVLEGNVKVERVRSNARAVDDNNLPLGIGKGNNHLVAREHLKGLVVLYENDCRPESHLPLKQFRKLVERLNLFYK